jgi:glycine betaine catabolism B
VPTITVPLLRVRAATPRSRLLALGLRSDPFEFSAGQAVRIGSSGQPFRRPYSLACSPERAAETGELELLIGLEPDSTLGPHLESAAEGSLLDVEGPLGTFSFPIDPPHQRLLFVAGGTGIAPLRAMIDHAVRRNGTPPMSLLYSARNGDEFAFIDELRGHAHRGRLELHQTVTRDESPTWAGARGRIGRSHFESVMHDPAATLCFVCGPRDMVGESVATLLALGVPEAAIRTEAWVVPRP